MTSSCAELAAQQRAPCTGGHRASRSAGVGPDSLGSVRRSTAGCCVTSTSIAAGRCSSVWIL